MKDAPLCALGSLLLLSLSLGCRSAEPSARSASELRDHAVEAPSACATTGKSSSTEARTPTFWTEPYPTPFPAATLAKQPAPIRVEGNRFVDASGQTVVFRGMSIADPQLLQQEGHFNLELFRKASEWGANVVRIPVHPAAFRELGKEAYLNLLDQAVRMASGLDLYLIIDWHSIGNLQTEMFQHPMYETSRQETFDFWRTIAFRYAGLPTVAFFELFNEPTDFGGQLGQANWSEWRGLNEQLIDVIRAHKNEAIPLVAGFNWAYELESVLEDPVRRAGVAYVSHPYPMKTKRPFAPGWDKAFGQVASRYPLVATEIGFARPGTKGAHEPVIDEGPYATEVTDYLESKGASWVAWVFHPEWGPPMIEDWSFRPTASGEAFRTILLERRAQGATPPEGSGLCASAPRCSLETPCAAGNGQCIEVPRCGTTVCLDYEQACELECGRPGKCALLKRMPPIVKCQAE